MSRLGKQGLTRRTLLRGVAAGAGLAAVAAPFPIRAQRSGRVFVRTSGGSYEEALQKGTWSKFTQATGIEVVPVAANTARILAMVEARNAELDLIKINEPGALSLRARNALDDLDRSKFSRTDLSQIDQVAKDYVVYSVFAECLVYNKEAFPQRHPTTWAEFWDVRTFPGRRSLQDAKAIAPNLEFALLADGVPMDKLYPIDIDRAFRKLREIKPSITKWYDTGALGASLLADKTVVVGSLWNNRAQVLMDQGAPIAIEWNQAMRLNEVACVLKSAPNKDNAYRLLDFSLQAEMQASSLVPISLAPSNRKAFEFIDPKRAENLPTAPQNLAKSFVTNGEWWVANRETVLTRWQEFLLT